MTSKFLTIPRLAVYLGIPIERAHALVEQEIITSIEVKGTTLADRASADQWRANQPKPTVKNTAPPVPGPYSKDEERRIREGYWTKTFEEIAEEIPGRTAVALQQHAHIMKREGRILPKGYISVKVAAARFKMTPDAVIALVRKGAVDHLRRPGRASPIYINKNALAAVIAGPPAPQAPPATVLPKPQERTWSSEEFGRAVGTSGRVIRRLCERGDILATRHPLSVRAGARKYAWIIPDSSRAAYLESKGAGQMTLRPDVPVENVPVFVRNRRAAESKDRAAFRAKLKAETIAIAELEPMPEATVETAPAARGGLLARVAAACAIFKRRRA